MSKRDSSDFFQDHRVLLRLISLLLLLASVTLDVQSFVWPRDNSYCVRATSAWSPALEAIRYKWGMFTEPARWEPRSPLVGKHKPSPQVEEAWAVLIPDGMITIPSNRLETLNHTKNFDWKRPGENADNIYAVPEVFLQINCLDFLRQRTYRIDYPRGYPDSHEPGLVARKPR
ncbi:hypothetical protein DL95DRAFT_389115 [Leptodontidium sp. 2 PMI_412]|nr:hypothetical protein DL95DRAFT_389115 [Leptodontidium sp. 2 PMI_412]